MLATHTSALRAGIKEWFKDKSDVLCFVAKFGFFMGLFYGVLLIPFVDRLVYDYLAANAWVAHGILNGLGFATHLDRTLISSADFSIAVRRGCDGLEPAALFASAVLAFPAPWRARLVGILLGTAILLALNVLRIVSLFGIGVIARPFFAKAHLEIWPLVFILAAMLLAAAWIRWVRRTPASP